MHQLPVRSHTPAAAGVRPYVTRGNLASPALIEGPSNFVKVWTTEQVLRPPKVGSVLRFAIQLRHLIRLGLPSHAVAQSMLPNGHLLSGVHICLLLPDVPPMSVTAAVRARRFGSGVARNPGLWFRGIPGAWPRMATTHSGRCPSSHRSRTRTRTGQGSLLAEIQDAPPMTPAPRSLVTGLVAVHQLRLGMVLPRTKSEREAA